MNFQINSRLQSIFAWKWRDDIESWTWWLKLVGWMMSRKLDHTNNFSKMRPTDNKFGSNFFSHCWQMVTFFRENRFDPEKHIFYEKITFMSPKCLCTWKARRKQCFQHSREHFTNYFTWNQFWLLNYTSHVILTYLGISLPLLWFYVKSILVRMRNDFT